MNLTCVIALNSSILPRPHQVKYSHALLLGLAHEANRISLHRNEALRI